MKPTGLAFTLIALGLATGTRPVPGQTMSFFRQFSTPAIDRATAVVADGSGIYVIGAGRLATYGSAGIRKYDSGGNELWTRELSINAAGSASGKRRARAGRLHASAPDATSWAVAAWVSPCAKSLYGGHFSPFS